MSAVRAITLLPVVLFGVGCAVAPTPESLRREAVSLRAGNDIGAAQAALRRAILLQSDKTADDRAALADLWRELAALHNSAGENTEAEDAYRQALRLVAADLSRAEAATNLRTQLAGLCYRQSRLQEAADLYHRVLQEEEKRLGVEHPDVLDTLSILAGLELKLRHLDQAELLFRRQLAGVTKLHGEEKRETASVLDNLADVAEQSGRKDEAAELRAKAARIRHKLCDEC